MANPTFSHDSLSSSLNGVLTGTVSSGYICFGIGFSMLISLLSLSLCTLDKLAISQFSSAHKIIVAPLKRSVGDPADRQPLDPGPRRKGGAPHRPGNTNFGFFTSLAPEVLGPGSPSRSSTFSCTDNKLLTHVNFSSRYIRQSARRSLHLQND